MRLLLSSLIALILVPAAFAAGPREQKISGTVSANSGASLTVTSGDRSLTCRVLGDKAQAALLRWGVGTSAAMSCKRDGDRLLLKRLSRLDSNEGKNAKNDGGNDGTGTTATRTETRPTTTHETEPTPPPPPPRHDPPATTATSPTAPPPPPPPPSSDRRDARGIVTALSSDSVTVRPDAGGDSLRCRITPAADSTAAAAKLSLGAHVGIVCRRDGDGYVLSGTTPVS